MEPGRELFVGDDQRNLEIEPEAPHVEVDGSEQADRQNDAYDSYKNCGISPYVLVHYSHQILILKYSCGFLCFVELRK